jgi:cytochrome bd ubiquinol oxidase subunit I
MEFEFDTNWSRFSQLTGGVIGQPLAMGGTFSFFLESLFLGLFLFGETRLGKWGHWCAAFLVLLGSWLSGFFIIVTDAWMQHPVAYTRRPNGMFSMTSFWALLTNPWALIQYAHNICGALATGAFVMAAAHAESRRRVSDTQGRLLSCGRPSLEIDLQVTNESGKAGRNW